ncbi:hypothetical protein MHEL_38800 [Mycolicibacterium helvum]|uniref:Uncharacterized protein n=1 Tax=Mycolicibacterium helvum TaxID=1534349 RepID=A0A7I7T8Q2_9MYCO|nr:hypothetical protein MHEL_38800 [Mycolicibacterium helvum]
MPSTARGRCATRDGLAAAGRTESSFAVVPEIILSAGEDHDATRRLLAFYGSTPAYRPVLDIHGWGDLQPELNSMSKQGKWLEMAGLISERVEPDRDRHTGRDRRRTGPLRSRDGHHGRGGL